MQFVKLLASSLFGGLVLYAAVGVPLILLLDLPLEISMVIGFVLGLIGSMAANTILYDWIWD